MKRMFELEQRFNQTGKNGVKALTNKELKELYKNYNECIWYFSETNNRAMEFWFMMNRNVVENCLNARGVKYV